jgi:hypothetical protein
MAGTGVLPFIRGIDLTLNDLEAEKFPEAMEDMTSLRCGRGLEPWDGLVAGWLVALNRGMAPRGFPGRGTQVVAL